MTNSELKQRGAIFLEKITEGFSNYASVKLTLDEKKAFMHFKNLKKEYGAENSFADFYYFRLDEGAREMVDEMLSGEERAYLQVIKPDEMCVEEELIFPLDDRLLKIIVKLNDREMLFSTIYFTTSDERGRTRTTWWGNYEHEYICFKDK